MRFRGGYNILLKGKPERSISAMPEPDVLYLPLQSRRFTFSELCVKEGEKVKGGEILAKDPDNYSVPLLAPRAGRVRLEEKEGHIVLDQVARLEEHADIAEDEIEHVERKMGTAGIKRYKLLTLGAWQFFYDAFTGELPDPLGTAQAIIVSTVSMEPFVARGDAQLHKRLRNFTRGLEQLQSLLEYQPIYLVMLDIQSELANLVRNHIRGYAWVKMLEIPLRYPYDDFSLLARRLGLKRDKGPVWAVRTEGVLATDRALTLTKPCTVRIISIGGTGVDEPAHIKVMSGYPVKDIKDEYVFEPEARLIDGGVLTGQTVSEEKLGLDAECRGLTVLPDAEEREFLGFMRPGQYVQVQAPSPSGPEFRAYSISSPAHEPNIVQLVVRLVPGGIGSTYLHNLKPGDTVNFTGPYGEFWLNEDPSVEIVCVGGGAGMAPMVNIIYTLYEKWPDRVCWLFFGCRTTKDIFYLEEFENLMKKRPNFHVVYALSDALEDGEKWDGETGFIHLSCDKHLEPGVRRQAFLCGPPLMIEAVTRVLEEKGAEEIFYDEF
jgi:Na(+)-translocating NADH:ubiquinone oxidoreductase A subunit